MAWGWDFQVGVPNAVEGLHSIVGSGSVVIIVFLVIAKWWWTNTRKMVSLIQQLFCCSFVVTFSCNTCKNPLHTVWLSFAFVYQTGHKKAVNNLLVSLRKAFSHVLVYARKHEELKAEWTWCMKWNIMVSPKLNLHTALILSNTIVSDIRRVTGLR